MAEKRGNRHALVRKTNRTVLTPKFKLEGNKFADDLPATEFETMKIKGERRDFCAGSERRTQFIRAMCYSILLYFSLEHWH